MSCSIGAAIGAAGPKKHAGNTNDFLAMKLGGEIIAGDFPEGERLPTEASLLARFRVSRPTLREALRVLAAKGLIVSRQKIGTIVRPKSEWNMLDPEVLAWRSGSATDDVLDRELHELREMIEPQAALLAAQRRNAGDLEKIRDAFHEMQRAIDLEAELTEADLRFHQAILTASGNRFLIALNALCESALRSAFQAGWTGPTSREVMLWLHERILAAIASGEAELARARSIELLRNAESQKATASGARSPREGLTTASNPDGGRHRSRLSEDRRGY